MPTFVFKARNASGDEVTGTLVADTTLAAARQLDERSLLPVRLEEMKARGKALLLGRGGRVSISKVGVIYEQLADLLRAGVPILRSLNVLAKQASSPALSRVLREVHDDVAGGDSLAEALGRHPTAFPELHVAMVRAGEKGGFLEDVLARLSQFVARQDALKHKFIGAMIYPSVLLFGLVGAVVFIMSSIVPQIRGVLKNQELGWATLTVFSASDLLTQHYTALLVGVGVAVLGAMMYARSAAGKLALARLQLKLPAIGKVYTMMSLCRFCRVFGTLLANGIPIIQALRIAKDSTGNVIIAESIDEAAESVSAGESLAIPLSTSKIFPPAIIDMIAVAEESNTLEKVLVEIADTQEERTARQIDFSMRLLEPLLLLLMGVMIGFIAFALLLPILKMSTSGLH